MRREFPQSPPGEPFPQVWFYRQGLQPNTWRKDATMSDPSQMPDSWFIKSLFAREVPEVREGIVKIRAMAREAGYRTKIAVSSNDASINAVSACVGGLACRIQKIKDALGGEMVDIVRWNPSARVFIGNALKPGTVDKVVLCFELDRATVVVEDSQRGLAVGKRGENARLAARLTEWDIDFLSPMEYETGLDRLRGTLMSVEGITPEMVHKVVALGLIKVRDIGPFGIGRLMGELGLDRVMAQRVVDRCIEESEET
jgi:N utilization substance protein A